MKIRGITGWIRRVYDRLVASIVLIFLVLSLVLLAVHARLLQGKQAEFDRWLANLKPKHEQAQPLDRSAYEATLLELKDPAQTGEWSLRLMIPEMRVRCLNCQRPMPLQAGVCPFCKAEKQKTAEIPEWEKNFGPLLKQEPNGDPDGDGFTTLEERDAHTSPLDPNSHPSYLTKLAVLDIKPVPFQLVFKAVSRVNDVLIFQINLRSNERTWWKKLGEEAGNKGESFKLTNYDEKASGGGELTLERGDKVIRLKKGKMHQEEAYEIVLRSALDGKKVVARTGGEFEVRGLVFRVKSVDIKGMRVLITEVSAGKDVWVSRDASDKKAADEP